MAAYSVGRALGLSEDESARALSDNDEKVFGRQEVINIDDKQTTLILVKNPVGLDQVLEMISTDKEPFSLAVMLNANYADGIDTSWIWDGNFEGLPFDRIPSVLTGGERYKDITFRLRVAGVPEKTSVSAKSSKTLFRLSNRCRLTMSTFWQHILPFCSCASF